MNEKTYAIRDAAFKEWCKDHVGLGSQPSYQDVFNAGWQARKFAQYKGETR